ncbi:MAG: MFS transporter [Pseudomonadota bacterium]|jgi:fucose permease|nr:MFS transporter [Pseudomonadota bacterium]
MSNNFNRYRLIGALALSFMIFAILLNSVGTVILQVIHTFAVDKPQASLLELFKDLPIVIASFALASFLPILGYRRSMIIALGIVAVACTLMPLFASFHTTELLFVCVGIGFALTKVSVYGSIGLLTATKTEHNRLTNTIEGLFMVGVVISGWLFSAFIPARSGPSAAWLHVYWVLVGACLLAMLLLAGARLDESQARDSARPFRQSLAEIRRLSLRPAVYAFLASIFLYVLIEQSFGTWLPTFNNEVLRLPDALAVQMASILAASIAVGRIVAGQLLRRMSWYVLLNICVLGMGLLIMLTLPLARQATGTPHDWAQAPTAAYLIPLIGLLMAPIYPVINSVILSALPKPAHAAMTGLILVFSALGGTLGSRITAIIFASYGGIRAFYFSLLPMALLLVTLFLLKSAAARAAAAREPAGH